MLWSSSRSEICYLDLSYCLFFKKAWVCRLLLWIVCLLWFQVASVEWKLVSVLLLLFFSIDCFQIRYEEFGRSFFQMLSVDFGLEELGDSNSVLGTKAGRWKKRLYLCEVVQTVLHGLCGNIWEQHGWTRYCKLTRQVMYKLWPKQGLRVADSASR